MSVRRAKHKSPEAPHAAPAFEALLADPDRIPGPLLRVSREGLLLYANALAAPVLEHWGLSEGGRLPGPAAAVVSQGGALGGKPPPKSSIPWGSRTKAWKRSSSASRSG